MDPYAPYGDLCVAFLISCIHIVFKVLYIVKYVRVLFFCGELVFFSDFMYVCLPIFVSFFDS